MEFYGSDEIQYGQLKLFQASTNTESVSNAYERFARICAFLDRKRGNSNNGIRYLSRGGFRMDIDASN